MGFFDDMDFGKITPAEPEDYSLDINNKTIFQDSRFLNDLREHYQETGESVDDDHELLKKFYSDRLWGDINTPSALYQAYKAQDASVDQRARMNRLQRVYEAMPNFWQDGGAADLFGKGYVASEIGQALLSDPINFVGGVGAARAGTMAALKGAR